MAAGLHPFIIVFPFPDCCNHAARQGEFPALSSPPSGTPLYKLLQTPIPLHHHHRHDGATLPVSVQQRRRGRKRRKRVGCLGRLIYTYNGTPLDNSQEEATPAKRARLEAMEDGGERGGEREEARENVTETMR